MQTDKILNHLITENGLCPRGIDIFNESQKDIYKVISASIKWVELFIEHENAIKMLEFLSEEEKYQDSGHRSPHQEPEEPRYACRTAQAVCPQAFPAHETARLCARSRTDDYRQERHPDSQCRRRHRRSLGRYDVRPRLG